MTGRTEGKKQGDSSPAHTPFKPQFFWSDKRIPLRVLGAFLASTATATSAAQFQLQYEACPGTGLYEKKKQKKRFPSLFLSWRGLPSYSLDQKDRAALGILSFHVHCTFPGVTLPLRPGQQIQEQKAKQETRHQIVYTPILQVLVPFPSPHATISFSESSESCFLHSAQGFYLHSVGRTDYVYSILVRTGTLRNVFLKLHTHLWKKENKYGPSTILSSSSNQVNT